MGSGDFLVIAELAEWLRLVVSRNSSQFPQNEASACFDGGVWGPSCEAGVWVVAWCCCSCQFLLLVVELVPGKKEELGDKWSSCVWCMFVEQAGEWLA